MMATRTNLIYNENDSWHLVYMYRDGDRLVYMYRDGDRLHKLIHTNGISVHRYDGNEGSYQQPCVNRALE